MGKTLGIMEKMKNRNNAFQKSKMLAIMGVLFLKCPIVWGGKLVLDIMPSRHTILFYFCMMLYEIELTHVKD
jgi:hypothetical protein